MQTVGVHQALGKPGSDTYKNWHEQVLKYRNGDPPPHGAIWLTYYPNVMVEWYPNVLVISTLYPTGPDSCRNVIEFYYPEEIALFEPEYVAAQQKAYHETAAYQKAMRKRAVWVEPLFGEAKQWHGLRQFRLRGLANVNIEGLLVAAGQNLKRWLVATGWGRRHGPLGSLLALPAPPPGPLGVGF